MGRRQLGQLLLGTLHCPGGVQRGGADTALPP